MIMYCSVVFIIVPVCFFKAKLYLGCSRMGGHIVYKILSDVLQADETLLPRESWGIAAATDGGHDSLVECPD